MAKAGKVVEFVQFVHEGTYVEHGNAQLRFYALFALWNHGFDDSRKFLNVILCSLRNPIGPNFRKSVYYDTLVALDPRLVVLVRPLRGLISRVGLVICGFWLAESKWIIWASRGPIYSCVCWDGGHFWQGDEGHYRVGERGGGVGCNSGVAGVF